MFNCMYCTYQAELASLAPVRHWLYFCEVGQLIKLPSSKATPSRSFSLNSISALTSCSMFELLIFL